MTSDSTVVSLRQHDTVDDPLTAVLRSGARRLLAQAIKAEALLAAMKGMQLPDGRDRRISRSFIRSVAAAIAMLHSASEKKVTFRKRPRM